MSVLEDTKYILKKYNIRANKSLGQNFLISEEVVNSIVDCSKITNEDILIEIGPGLGTLTAKLLEKANKVICVELDTRMIGILEKRFELYDNLEIINKDILKVDLNSLIAEQKELTGAKNVKVVANLPYYITTPIIMKLLENNLDIDSITVMIQKEVADRLIANPGEKDAGAITYSVYYYCESEKIMEVPNFSFIPEPEVTSEVIKLNLRKQPPVDVKDKEKMLKIVKNAFTQRRKTLLNALTNTKVLQNKEEGTKLFAKLNLDINARAEELTLQDFANLSNEL